jgi:HEAT repeat protein
MTGMQMSGAAVAHAVGDALRAAADGDDDRRWELITQLHIHGGSHALDEAARLRQDPEPTHRALAADILSQLGAAPGRAAVDGPFRDDALLLLLDMVQHEHEPVVLQSITVGFGHIGDERCVAPLIRLHAHPDAEVREGVVFGLLGRTETASLETLMTLSTDREPEVRDWATFGLARQTDRDFPQLRDALAARLGDDDPDTLAEAIHGLAVRADPRAMRPLLRALEASPDRGDIHFIITEALYALAIATADPRLYPHLLADRDGWISDAPDEDLPPLLQSALTRYATTLTNRGSGR